MFGTDEDDICINFGCVEEDCRNCDSMCNSKCPNYESHNTRRVELDKLHEEFKVSNN